MAGERADGTAAGEARREGAAEGSGSGSGSDSGSGRMRRLGPTFRRAVDFLAARSPRELVAIAIPIVLAIGFADYVTGWEVSFSIFYLAPVGAAAWFGGRTAGLTTALAGAATWFAADLLAGAAYSHPLIPWWNATVRFGFFVLTTYALTEIRRGQRSTEERFRRLVEGVRDYAIILLDRDGHVSAWNSGAERIFGYPPGEVEGRHVALFYPEDDVRAGKPMRILKIAAAEGRAADEGFRVRKDRSRFFASAIVASLRDAAGSLYGFSKVVRDVTERRLADQAYRESEERFRLLLDGFGDVAVVLVDPQGRVATWNAGAERLFGYRTEEILGSHVSCLDADAGADRGRIDADLRAALATGRVETEGPHVRRDGTRFWAKAKVVRLRDDSGAHRGYSVVVREPPPETD